MARPLRLKSAGAVYHVTIRGNGQQETYLTDDDRHQLIEFLLQVCDRYGW